MPSKRGVFYQKRSDAMLRRWQNDRKYREMMSRMAKKLWKEGVFDTRRVLPPMTKDQAKVYKRWRSYGYDREAAVKEAMCMSSEKRR